MWSRPSEIFDLNKKGISLKKIAKEIYPIEYRRGQYGTMDSLIKKVKKILKRLIGSLNQEEKYFSYLK
jgi:hypothetical protein